MKRKVLIVDDDRRNTFALTAVLHSRGYDCISATGMDEAFTLLEQGPGINFILMDMMMPGMDGYEAIPKLKADRRYREIPVIAVTAQAMTGDREKCLAAGADDYATKPINIDVLTAVLNKYAS